MKDYIVTRAVLYKEIFRVRAEDEAGASLAADHRPFPDEWDHMWQTDEWIKEDK